jgi:glycosyltransferase involved in cell wall biosynthesis
MPHDAMLTAPPRARTVPSGSGSAPLRVLMVIDSLGPGGAERLLLDYLPRLAEMGVEARVCVLSERHGNPIAHELRRLGVPVDLVPVRRLADLAGAMRVVRYIRRVQPDLVHTQLQFADTIGAMAARLLSRPVVSTLHTMSDSPSRSREALRVFVAERSLGASADRIIAVSDAARRYYERSTALPARKLTTLRNGIDLPAFRAEVAASEGVRDELGIPGDAVVAATVAVLRPQKGVEIMLRALPALLAERPELVYLVVGDGPDARRLRGLAAELGVRDHVRFPGSRTDVARLLGACDLLVHPSLEDALPTSLMEAMAAGLPIVAGAVGGVPEMVEEGRTGRLVPPGDVAALTAAVRELLADADLRAAMGREGELLVAECFDLDTQARRLRDLYLDVLRDRGRR